MKETRISVDRVMKYIILGLIIAFVVVLMVFMSGSNRPFEEVQSEVEKSFDASELKEQDSAAVKRNFGLNSADYDGVMYYASESSMSVEEVLLIKVKSREQIQEVTDALDERTQARIAAFEGYGSDEVRLLEDAQQSVRGRFIFFAVSSQAGEYRSVFDSSL